MLPKLMARCSLMVRVVTMLTLAWPVAAVQSCVASPTQVPNGVFDTAAIAGAAQKASATTAEAIRVL
jgi:hypothetical protein